MSTKSKELAERICTLLNIDIDALWNMKNVVAVIEEIDEALDQAWRIGLEARTSVDQGTIEAAKMGQIQKDCEIVFKECGNGCTSDHRDYIIERIRAQNRGGDE